MATEGDMARATAASATAFAESLDATRDTQSPWRETSGLVAGVATVGGRRAPPRVPRAAPPPALHPVALARDVGAGGGGGDDGEPQPLQVARPHVAVVQRPGGDGGSRVHRAGHGHHRGIAEEIGRASYRER